ncbi:myeloid cell surface antigen CD33-like isoform X1 [Grammomys surdaster]|uniref:myeloid cell surface antigen CD33-like isoform X1 n=1 Tax=Grammomys surdaster TaxID=491861 RepID=UPI0010A05C91|nr:myeloid cell surface antigen CD33-like isoform X1 [Grammomys surdaster]XP_028641617.1 myeloid cell surface antigen CD33-like isoform X1 [Grammomys surdaster]
MLWPLLLLLLCAGSLAQESEFQMVAPKSVTVEEGLCVHVPCNVSYPSIGPTFGPVIGSWLQEGASLHEDSPVATNDPRQLVQKATRGRFLLLGDPQNHDCSLLIRDAQKNDTGVYFFRVVREPFVRYSYKKSQLSLHVTPLSRTPDIIMPGILEAGHPSNLTCSVPWACEQGTPPTFSWMSAALTSLSSRTTNSSVLTLTPQPLDHGTQLTCLVTFSGAGVTVKRTIQLNVTWKSGQMREVVLVAVGEAAIKLLILGLCLVFLIVIFCRRKTTKLSVHVGCENPITAHQQDPKAHSNSENPRPLQKALP